jgi:3-phosphoshikimate 1-carboxyvinyltransferase
LRSGAKGAAKTRESETQVSVEGGSRLTAAEIRVPGDPSAAAFFLVAALILPDSEVVIEGVAMNPTRRGAIDALIEMGGEIELRGLHDDGFEPVATVVARSSRLTGIEIGESRIPSLIDELPVLAVAAAFASGTTTVRGAEELRVKESDRIDRICRSLTAAGVRVEERTDGFIVHGGPRPHEAVIDAFGDHRIALAMAVLGLGASGPVEIHGAGGIATSFPGFADQLGQVRALR